ncbi:MAG: hypothetical protein QOF51_3497 [Chloroflexota bacterium]|jgi:hypothetical protein|nr:hypothetical protein [Chloroflexota bacterium]
MAVGAAISPAVGEGVAVAVGDGVLVSVAVAVLVADGGAGEVEPAGVASAARAEPAPVVRLTMNAAMSEVRVSKKDRISVATRQSSRLTGGQRVTGTAWPNGQ